MSGRLIAIVGPSGVGKDSVMAALVAHDPRFKLARRVITRPSDAGGEDFDGVSEAAFLAREAAGDFALSWPAHGLHYAIPADVDALLQDGYDVLANLSRSVLAQANTRFDRFDVINLTAKRAVLAKRLAARGRETAEQIALRLDRVATLPAGIDAHEIDNSGALSDTVQAVMASLYPVKA
ncbi:MULTISPECIES: phosphonate metabolism protein/1,5-bisphosphokinase (PRPP-forming) PhnN [Pacificibacter]|uniref:phosphonate metabolism protein/1,5-bisphosphokinase (PRPP-forming) PhnN n=1 Tax=Pacificibacter TaxID=1042323 RepID=UPI001C097D95|nr:MULTISPECIES: phosphonate metabolism protein/1,5-bisphosphokinase (PRPP-forming) PhnN [Pacificibacter]MBU2935672.1 phosphonate metabolism protein/1,5-bisphosphokinase (PRPP-forming) PhnN [Pacificibacter marinus]MDO6614168.1 phosphonate metabolism protein/1,5-bisphosphokinase (PRPP-forming) PhnN [Pacificibacter sp. 1_MG-2023]